MAVYDRLVFGSLALVPTVFFSIVTAPCPAYPIENGGWSCYEPSTRTIYAPRFDRFTFIHEVGHAYDFQVMSDTDRAEVQPMLTQSSGLWSGGTFYGADEEFASAYAGCVMGNEFANRPVCAWLDRHPADVESLAIR